MDVLIGPGWSASALRRHISQSLPRSGTGKDSTAGLAEKNGQARRDFEFTLTVHHHLRSGSAIT
jgi:hypothetical protein